MDILTLSMANADARRRFAKSSRRTLGVLGDSITHNGYSYGANTSVKNIRGYWTWLLALTGQRLQLVAQGGISGETTAQMIARITPYLATNPFWNVVHAGTNDVIQGSTLAQIETNLTALWDAIENNGGRVVAVTLGPNDTASNAQKQLIHDVNGWIRRQGYTRKNLLVADTFVLLANNSGIHAGNMSNDGLHPTGLGAYIIGKAISDVIAPFVTGTPVLPAPGDTRNLNTNPMNTGTAGSLGNGVTGSVADGYSAAVIGTTVATVSVVARNNVYGGNYGYWHHVTLTSGGVNLYRQYAPGGAWSVGDAVYGIAEIQLGTDLTPSATGQYLRLKAYANNAAFTDLFQAYDFSNGAGMPFPIAGSLPPAPIVLATEPFVIPAGTDRSVGLGIQSTVPGSFDVGRTGLYKVGTGPLYESDYTLFTAPSA